MTNPYQHPDATLDQHKPATSILDQPWVQLLRWVILVPAIFFSFFVGVVLVLNFVTGENMLSALGSICAYLVVLTAFFIAPKHKLLVTNVTFCIGAIVAFMLITGLDPGPKALSTIIVTCLGGLLGVMSCWFFSRG